MGTLDERFIREFIRSFEEEYIELAERLELLKRSHQIDYASGSDLDKLGELFEYTRVSGKDDETYRKELKTYVTSFMGGGTEQSFKNAFNLRFGYNVFTKDVTPIPTVEVVIDISSIPGGDPSVVDTTTVQELINNTKGAGINGTYSFMLPIPEETIPSMSEIISVVPGAAGYLLWDIGLWDTHKFF